MHLPIFSRTSYLQGRFFLCVRPSRPTDAPNYYTLLIAQDKSAKIGSWVSFFLPLLPLPLVSTYLNAKQKFLYQVRSVKLGYFSTRNALTRDFKLFFKTPTLGFFFWLTVG